MQVRDFLYELNAYANSPLNAKRKVRLENLCQFHNNLKLNTESVEVVELDIPFYHGQNSNVESLIRDLREEDAISSVILQGSLATNEEIEYSDFDALIVLSEKAFGTAEHLENTIRLLQRLSRHVYGQDPIQHHGWFLTTESLLNHHYDDFFPLEIFNHSVVLYPKCHSLPLKIGLIYSQGAYLKNLESTVKSVRQEFRNRQCLNNIYELKSTLSKVMLLPALYMQVKLGKGVYKKDSFNLAIKDFGEEEWEAIEFASQLRLEWNQSMPYWKRFLITSFPSYSRKIAKRIAPKVVEELRIAVEAKSDKMMTFAELILERAKELNVESKP